MDVVKKRGARGARKKRLLHEAQKQSAENKQGREKRIKNEVGDATDVNGDDQDFEFEHEKKMQDDDLGEDADKDVEMDNEDDDDDDDNIREVEVFDWAPGDIVEVTEDGRFFQVFDWAPGDIVEVTEDGRFFQAILIAEVGERLSLRVLQPSELHREPLEATIYYDKKMCKKLEADKVGLLEKFHDSPDGVLEALQDFLTSEDTPTGEQNVLLKALNNVFEGYEFPKNERPDMEDLMKGRDELGALDLDKLHDVVVVGAGAAGIGVGVALTHAGIEDLVIVDRSAVGASFRNWPAETRFITPSFPTNSIGMLDLNAVALETSPAASLHTEHPTGAQFADYLGVVAKHWKLPIYEGIDVLDIEKVDEEFHIATGSGEHTDGKTLLRAKHVVWAGGEFQYPHKSGVEGFEHCTQTAKVDKYEALEGDDFIVIGGYESGIDAAYHLASRGKKVRIYDRGCPWEEESTDPSISLSTYTQMRMKESRFTDNVSLHSNTPIESVSVSDDGKTYTVTTGAGEKLTSASAPLFAAGFAGSHRDLIEKELFEARPKDGFPELSEDDESTVTKGIFLVGPALRHSLDDDDFVFCFIFKFRQRFAVVAKAIASSLGLFAESIELYRLMGMYLDDLSCCGAECAC